MMSHLLEIERETVPASVICLVERYMKCGVGICGSCSIGGFRACVDGPWFEEWRLRECDDFGTYVRDASGMRKELRAPREHRNRNIVKK